MTLIVIPWRDTDHGRAIACRWTCQTFRHLLPSVPLVLVDSGHEPFNRAASRNLGVSYADTREVVVISDADVMVERVRGSRTSALDAAVATAGDGRLHYPFTVCHYLTAEATADVYDGQLPDVSRVELSIPAAQGGLMVMRADTWRLAGGMDERFTGWGYEDNDWYTRVTRSIGAPARHHGVLWHLYHPSERNSGTVHELSNRALARDQERS